MVVVVVVVSINSKEIIVVGYCYRRPPLKLRCRYQFFKFNSFLAYILRALQSGPLFLLLPNSPCGTKKLIENYTPPL